MRKKGYMFTDKSQSERGKISATLGAVAFVSIMLVIYLSYESGGLMSPKLGAAAFFALLFSIVGEVIGIISRTEKDKFYFFPNLGILLNTLTIVIVGTILYLGVSGI